MRTKDKMRESEFIDWLFSQSDFDPAAVPVGPGDDMAVVMCGSEELLITTDQALDGVHFSLARCGPEAAGRKAMARSLSDVAAMAAIPFGAVAAVALPKGFQQPDAEAMYRGLRSISDPFECPIVGGDVAVWDKPLAISVTIFARPTGPGPVLRSGAKPGDAICVTGSFGGAWASQRHLEFMPRIREARRLGERCELHAMIDVSDGLAADLGHLARASGVGAEILAANVPIHPDVDARDEAGRLRAALGDGEDYELLFALPAEQAEQLVRDQPLTVPIRRIGTVISGEALRLIGPDGRGEPLQVPGWEHET
jgi:thiamine-monophosphate kinase